VSCKLCGNDMHTAWQCPTKPRKPLKCMGNVGKKWQSARKLWLKKHPGETFACFYCKQPLKRSEITLDHYLSRGRHPELRNELSNLVVACWSCNNRKGSVSGDEFKEKLRMETEDANT
jgi:5-methylcytosine-specific restriction endonuclease McrA